MPQAAQLENNDNSGYKERGRESTAVKTGELQRTKSASFTDFRREDLGPVERHGIVVERAQALATEGSGCQS